MSANTKFTKQSVLEKPPSSFKSKLYFVTLFLNSNVIPKAGESNFMSNPVTSTSPPSTRESKVMKNDNVIASGMFRIDPFKTSRVDNVMPNKPVKASIRTNPIIVSQPRENVNPNSKGYGDLQWGNILISRVYFIEGLGHNLLLVRKLYEDEEHFIRICLQVLNLVQEIAEQPKLVEKEALRLTEDLNQKVQKVEHLLHEVKK
nr:hypothetical protein [Tanacetum cinerariifolium]